MPTLTKEQQDIVNDNSQKIVVLAGPGTGKTSTLLAKIDSTIQNIKEEHQWWSKYQKPPVLFISFSNKTVDDVKTKLETKYGKSWESDNLIEVKTLHGFASKILVENDPDYNSNFQPVDAEKFKAFVRSKVEQQLKKLKLNLNHYEKKCLIKKLISAFEQALNNKKVKLNKKETKIFKNLQAKKKDDGIILFQEQINECWLLLLNDKKLMKKIKDQYQLLLVDEFQDLNIHQIELVHQLSKIDQVLIVGDDAQTIYEFQGSCLTGLKYITTILKAKNYSLTHSFRLTTEVAKAVNFLRKELKDVSPLKLETSKKGNKPFYSKVAAPNDQDKVVKNIIKSLIEDYGLNLEDIMILGRTKISLKEIYGLLVSQNYDVQFGDPEILNTTCLITVAMLELWEGGSLEIKSVLEYLKIDSSEENITAIKNLRKIKDGDKNLNYLISKLKEGAKFKNFESRIDIILDVLRRGCSKKEKAFIASYIAQIKFRIGDLDLKQITKAVKIINSYQDKNEGIVLNTVHGSKGLERKAIIIVDLVDGYFPYTKIFLKKNFTKKQIRIKRAKLMEEEKRLLYVALSRPIDHLFLISSPYTDKPREDNTSCSLLSDGLLKHFRLTL